MLPEALKHLHDIRHAAERYGNNREPRLPNGAKEDG